jgi:membrane protease YdiL (CAAX protease family)
MAMNATRTVEASGAPHTGLRVFGVLMIAAALASVAIIPYALTISGASVPDTPMWRWVVVSVAQSLLVIAPLTALGLWLGPKVGLGAPLLAAWIESRTRAMRSAVSALPVAAGIGAVTGVLTVAGSLVFVPWLPEELGQAAVPSWWQGLLAALSAGVTEELMLRLGVMTLLVWLGTRLARRGVPSPGIVWTANAVAALAFGALHLPLAASLAPLTAALVARTLVLNGFVGMVFGWEYWRHGLVAGMVAHTSADIVLHVLTPLLVTSA